MLYLPLPPYNNPMERYEQIPHTADLAARIYGKTLEDLFSNAAFAMFDMMASVGTGRQVEVKVEVEGPDREGLLISFLNELLYVSYIKNASFETFRFKEFTEKKISATAEGKQRGAQRPEHEIKAATYHDVKIVKTAEGYETTIVFDI